MIYYRKTLFGSGPKLTAVQLKDQIILIYCGNKFGRSSLGWAQMSLEDFYRIIELLQ
jgi:hypothetical protein